MSNCLQDGKVKKKKKEKKSKKKKEKKKSKKEKKTAEEDGSSDGSEVDLYTNPNPLPPHHHHLPNFLFSLSFFLFPRALRMSGLRLSLSPKPENLGRFPVTPNLQKITSAQTRMFRSSIFI